jgi:hypothetical protein
MMQVKKANAPAAFMIMPRPATLPLATRRSADNGVNGPSQDGGGKERTEADEEPEGDFQEREQGDKNDVPVCVA